MKLLIITQKVDINDDALGFFTRWLDEFSKHCDKVTVICLEKGEYKTPSNVEVLSLGKEHNVSRLKYIALFFTYIFRRRKEYDAVFVHMNPVYVVLGGLYWRLLGKKIALWYTHRSADLKLKIAEKLSHIVFTAAPESFSLPSKKVNVVGHGIDVDAFSCGDMAKNDCFTILHVGRITKIKNCDLLVKALVILEQRLGKKCEAHFVGKPIMREDSAYAEYLKRLIEENGLSSRVHFAGSVANREVKSWYCKCDVTVNMTPVGGIDKAVLESMSAGIPAVVSNTAFENYFEKHAQDLIFKYQDAESLADKLFHVAILPDNEKLALGQFLRRTAEDRASLKRLVPKLVRIMSELRV